jgi:hypothetical protein
VCHEYRLSMMVRNCTRDEGGPFELGNQVPISDRKLLRSKAVVVSVAETPGQDTGRKVGEASYSHAMWQPAVDGRFDQIGARKASETVILTFRMLHHSRLAMLSAFAVASARSSSSHRRPRAIEAIKR